MSARWRVPLPAGAEPPYHVWVSGVAQEEGTDYDVHDHALYFRKPLVQEGRLGFWRWASMFLGLVGTYRRDDSVDVRYRAAGREHMATRLDVEPPSEASPDGG